MALLKDTNMNEFDLFRINCWLEDIEDNEYETSIAAIICEFLMSHDNKEQLRNDIFDFIRRKLGIKINHDHYINIIAENNNFILEPTEDDILIKLKDESVQKFRERHDKFSIDAFINQYCEERKIINKADSIKSVLLKSLYKNINSFAVADLKSLISESIRTEFDQEEIELFNSFLDWENNLKNKAIYALFSKSIEFAILTSGRGVSSISNKIFINKTYYLDTNVVIRALGVDGEQRQESIISIIESCNHDGIKFKLAKVSYDEIYKNLNGRTNELKKKTTPDSEGILCNLIDDLPLNSSFETDYLKRRKAGIVSSPNNYRLSLEKLFHSFCDKYKIEIEPIKGIRQSELARLQKRLFERKHNKYGRWSYTMGAALVDATNLLHVRQVRDHNDYNYKDIKSFYLTTDGTLNEIAIDENPDLIAETILPSQLFVIHNSFHKVEKEEDYADFIKYIKMRRTDFNLPGQEVFSYLNQIRETSSNPEDIVSSLKAYANYRFEHRFNKLEKEEKLIPLKEFASNLLEKELGESRIKINQLDRARKQAILRLPKLMKISFIASYVFEVVLLSSIAIIISLLNTSLKAFSMIIIGIVVFRVVLLLMKDKFGVNKAIRNLVFDNLIRREAYFKIHREDADYQEEIKKIKNNAS